MQPNDEDIININSANIKALLEKRAKRPARKPGTPGRIKRSVPPTRSTDNVADFLVLPGTSTDQIDVEQPTVEQIAERRVNQNVQNDEQFEPASSIRPLEINQSQENLINDDRLIPTLPTTVSTVPFGTARTELNNSQHGPLELYETWSTSSTSLVSDNQPQQYDQYRRNMFGENNFQHVPVQTYEDYSTSTSSSMLEINQYQQNTEFGLPNNSQTPSTSSYIFTNEQSQENNALEMPNMFQRNNSQSYLTQPSTSSYPFVVENNQSQRNIAFETPDIYEQNNSQSYLLHQTTSSQYMFANTNAQQNTGLRIANIPEANNFTPFFTYGFNHSQENITAGPNSYRSDRLQRQSDIFGTFQVKHSYQTAPTPVINNTFPFEMMQPQQPTGETENAQYSQANDRICQTEESNHEFWIPVDQQNQEVQTIYFVNDKQWDNDDYPIQTTSNDYSHVNSMYRKSVKRLDTSRASHTSSTTLHNIWRPSSPRSPRTVNKLSNLILDIETDKVQVEMCYQPKSSTKTLTLNKEKPKTDNTRSETLISERSAGPAIEQSRPEHPTTSFYCITSSIDMLPYMTPTEDEDYIPLCCKRSEPNIQSDSNWTRKHEHDNDEH